MKILPFVLLGLIIPAVASAQPVRDSAKEKEKAIEDARRRLSEVIPTAEYQEKLPFAKFLDSLNKQLFKESKFTIRLDRDGFGKSADKILQAEISMPPVPQKMVANTALRLALAQTPTGDYEIEFVYGPDALLITTRDRSLSTATYDIRDLLEHVPRLHREIQQDTKETPRPRSLIPGVFFFHVDPDGEDFDVNADPAKPDQWLMRQIIALTASKRAGWHKRTPPSTIRAINGTKLEVYTTPSVHAEIDNLLATLRKLTDLFVVMDAKVYAIDRAEYDTQFASEFIDPKDKAKRRLAVMASEAIRKRLKDRKPIFTSDFDKLRPDERSVFLAQKNAYQYQAGPGDARPTTAFEGFSFAVRPSVSPDRRCLRLELFHDVEQLVKLTKGAMLDLKTGKELPIELPNLRKSAASDTIEIHDGHAIMLAVDYRPKDKVWLVVAEPMIYMEEEQELIRKGLIAPIEGLMPKPPVPLPGNDDVKQILEAIVADVLTAPGHEKLHADYGTPGDGMFALLPGHEITWPKGFRPSIAGFTQQEVDPDACRFSKKNKLLGIRVSEIEWTPNEKNPTGAKLTVTLSDANRSVHGALFILYEAKRVGKGWKAFAGEAFTR